jgi:cyclohexadieny/prephenate dehydrogenase
MADPACERLALIGVGLIGSSIARAARQFGAARHIAVMDSSQEVVGRASELGLADVATQEYAQAVRGADLVIVCTPVGACGDVAQSLAPHLEKGAVLSDVGSVKGAVVAQMTPHLAEPARFIPAHPIAGTEFSGPDAGFATLFQNRWCILTPPENADGTAVRTLTDFWMRLGANVETMSVAHHDAVLALTSHLPHLIAYNIVGTADDFGDETRSEVIKFSASGFRDFTRIAASDPIMWRDIFLANKDAVLQMLGRFNEDLSVLQRMIRRNDGQGLLEFFSRTRDIRRSIVEQGQDTAAPDFGRRTEGR